MPLSGADNGTNRANCDTSTKFGTNVLWGLLVKICPMGHLKIQDGGQVFKMAAISTIQNYFFNKMHLFGGFQ